MKQRAEITVFLSLICASVCAFILIVINSAKIHSEKFQAEALTDLAIRSAFSEYDKNIYENNGVLCVNTLYHGETGKDESFAKHVENYIDASLQRLNYKSANNLKVERVEVLESKYFNYEDAENFGIAYDTEYLLYYAKVKAYFKGTMNRNYTVIKEYSLR